MRIDAEKAKVERHLRRVLVSSEFSRSTNASSFLEFVVTHALMQEESLLRERTIGIAVFHRAQDWDPKLDTTVRTEARRVRKKLSVYYASPAAEGEDVQIELPLGGYVPSFRFTPQPQQPLPLFATEALEAPRPTIVASQWPPALLYKWSVAGMVVLTGLAIATGLALRSRTSASDIGLFKTVPLTSEFGQQWSPSISPDSTLVAYVSANESDGYHIYLRSSEGGVPRRLTTATASELSPSFSPDGSQIAFLRPKGVLTEVVVREFVEGTEKIAGYIQTQIGDWTGDPGPLIGNPGPAWTRDGAGLVVSDHPPHSALGGLVVIKLADGSREQLTVTEGSDEDFLPRVAPDGRRVAFIRASTHGHAELFVVDLKTRAVRRVTNEDHSINGLTWTKDPNELIVSSNREGPYQLWTVNTLTGAFVKIDTDASNAIDPQFSANASWLAYVTTNQEWTVQRLRIAGSPIGQLERFVASAGRNHSAHFSPDGRYVAFVSDRSGSWEIWLCGDGCSEPQQLSNFHGPWIGGLTWSPDSTHLAFDARLGPKSAIYTMSIADSKPQLVEKNTFEERMPYWSEDGGALYFNSDRDGKIAVWKRNLKSGVVTRTGEGFSTREYGPKRRVLLGRSDGSIYEPESVPGAGGKSIRLITDPVLAWTVHGSTIYYCAFQPDGRVNILAYENGRSKKIADEGISFPRTAASLDVSSDGRYLLLTVSEHSTSNIYRRMAIR